jgi:hypothetical protein
MSSFSSAWLDAIYRQMLSIHSRPQFTGKSSQGSRPTFPSDLQLTGAGAYYKATGCCSKALVDGAPQGKTAKASLTVKETSFASNRSPGTARSILRIDRLRIDLKR